MRIVVLIPEVDPWPTLEILCAGCGMPCRAAAERDDSLTPWFRALLPMLRRFLPVDEPLAVELPGTYLCPDCHLSAVHLDVS